MIIFLQWMKQVCVMSNVLIFTNKHWRNTIYHQLHAAFLCVFLLSFSYMDLSFIVLVHSMAPMFPRGAELKCADISLLRWKVLRYQYITETDYEIKIEDFLANLKSIVWQHFRNPL